jgi:hypothetical protein
MGAAAGLVLAVMQVRDRALPAALTETAAPFHDDAAVAGRDRFRATHRGTVLTMVSNRANPKQ